MNSYIYEKGKFIIKDYAKQKQFSSFLPGISGLKGVPIWVFYVNRGQGIASFGVDNKQDAIMEFSPLNTALERIDQIGFRTFLKINNQFVEAFKEDASTTMEITSTYFRIEEENKDYGYQLKITYLTIPNKPFGGLVRYVELKNISNSKVRIELLDGLTEIMPYGTKLNLYKDMSNLLRSWMNVVIQGSSVFYKLKSSTDDASLIDSVDYANYMYSSSNKGTIDYIYDKDMVFTYSKSLSKPHGFISSSIDVKNQTKENEVPCAYAYSTIDLDSNESYVLMSIYGNTDLSSYQEESLPTYQDFNKLVEENNQLIEDITKSIKTKTSSSIFDDYLMQCQLDNILRGGYPIKVGNKLQYVYSRKHGDLERDYNQFSTKAMYYSYGEGNFRDVLQNRRNDVLISKEASKANIEYFFSLVQLDGYNPLGVDGIKFVVEDKQILNKYKNNLSLSSYLTKGFSFGDLYKFNLKEEEILSIINASKEKMLASFKEGYWVDHFIYLLDLLKEYQAIYPDEMKNLLYQESYKYYQSPMIVKPTSSCSYLTSKGVRRASPLQECSLPSWINVNSKEYKTTLMSKLINLIASKMTCLDYENIGLDMNASRPGWNDALNGLPSIYGSSITDLYELKKLVDYTKDLYLENCQDITLLDIQYNLINEIANNIALSDNDYYFYFDKYRNSFNKELIRNNYKITTLSKDKASLFLKLVQQKLERSIQKALSINQGIYPTYAMYKVTDYKKTNEFENGLERVIPMEMVLESIPNFLEGITKGITPSSISQVNYVEKSELYDKQLGLFKVSEPLDKLSLEIGRIYSFTKGWLERESCFLHMEYKYLYSLIRNGFYDQFYSYIKTALVCNFDVEKYGRSPLENCSFIVSSNHLDKSKFGQGFQPRLSGANAEMISIWKEMFIGSTPFTLKNNKLTFELKPSLTKEMFINNQIETTFLNTKIIYVNAKTTYKENRNYTYKLIYTDKEIDLTSVEGQYALDIRDGLVKQIIVTL